MRTLVIIAVLLLTCMLSVAAVAGEHAAVQPAPVLSQPVNDAQLGQFRGGMTNPADYARVNRNVSTTQQVSGDTVNFSQDVMATMKGYNTHPPSDPSIGPKGAGPAGGVGPTWLKGPDITQHNR
jgi:hypothetical protein